MLVSNNALFDYILSTHCGVMMPCYELSKCPSYVVSDSVQFESICVCVCVCVCVCACACVGGLIYVVFIIL